MPNEADYRYEVFVSFAAGDRDWVQGYLLPALALPSGRVITDQPTSSSESFQLGAPVVSEFERAVTNSRFTLLVLSRAYLSDQWSTFGEQLASYTAVAEQRDHLIPLLRERDCPLPLHIEFRVSLDCTEQSRWEAEIGRLRQLLAQPEPKPERIPCPYPGMVPFQEKDARFFYGREAEIRQMLLYFRSQRLLFVIGPSGCGKSSLVFAGVLPQLQSSAYFDEGFWLVKQMRPGPHPLQKLCTVLGGDPTSESVAKLLTANPPAQRLLLVVDQFEELFSQAERAEQSGFMAALQILRAVENCALLITMRADFYPELMNSDIWGEASSHRVEIAPLRGDALRAAIEKPAGDVGVYLERGLVDRLVSDAAEEPGSLPLLQETMRLLWAEMARRFLPLGAYERLGAGSRSGLAVAIANKADATLNDLPSAQQKTIARRIFLRLVQFGEGRPDTRRQQPVSSLRSERDNPQLFDKTLRHLADNRLVTVTGEEGGPERKVDLAHEALISGWPQLQQWLKERRGAEQTRRRLEDKADEWIRLDRKGGLLDEVEIKEAEQWLQGPDAVELGGQSVALQDLLQASVAAVQEQKKQAEDARQRRLSQAQSLGSREGPTVGAYRGDGTVMLAFSLDERLTDNLAGFAVYCTPPTGSPYYLSGLLNFEQGIHSGTTPEELRTIPSDQAPFQAFRYIHRPEDLVPGPYEYTVSAMYFRPDGRLTSRSTVAVEVELRPFSSGLLEVGFTRGWGSPEGFIRKFGKLNLPQARIRMAWLSRPEDGVRLSGGVYS